MGNAAAIGELAGINDLEDLYQLDASENSPEGDDEDEDDGAQPDEIPHEAQPDEIPHE
jgi:hypothetical protein